MLVGGPGLLVIRPKTLLGSSIATVKTASLSPETQLWLGQAPSAGYGSRPYVKLAGCVSFGTSSSRAWACGQTQHGVYGQSDESLTCRLAYKVGLKGNGGACHLQRHPLKQPRP